jgi:hypothetical protein
MKVLPFQPSLKRICLQRNDITLNTCDDLLSVLVGRPAVVEDDQKLKNTSKFIADRNKTLKDVNKKRKKSSLPDLVDIVAPSDRLIKLGTESVILNRSLLFLDLSYNPFLISSISSFIQNLSTKELELSNVGIPQCSLNLILKGISDADIESLQVQLSPLHALGDNYMKVRL